MDDASRSPNYSPRRRGHGGAESLQAQITTHKKTKQKNKREQPKTTAKKRIGAPVKYSTAEWSGALLLVLMLSTRSWRIFALECFWSSDLGRARFGIAEAKAPKPTAEQLWRGKLPTQTPGTSAQDCFWAGRARAKHAKPIAKLMLGQRWGGICKGNMTRSMESNGRCRKTMVDCEPNWARPRLNSSRQGRAAHVTECVFQPRRGANTAPQFRQTQTQAAKQCRGRARHAEGPTTATPTGCP